MKNYSSILIVVFGYIMFAISGSMFWLDKVPFLVEIRFKEVSSAQYLAFFIFLFISFLGASLLVPFGMKIVKKIFVRNKSSFLASVFTLLINPCKWIVLVILLKVALEVYSWPLWISSMLSQVFKLFVAVSITMAFAKMIDVIFVFWKTRTNADKFFTEQVIPLLNRVVRYIVIFIGFVTAASNLGIDVTSILALGSVGGLAVGLATQDLLNNVFGGVVIFLDKPFRIGDRIQIQGYDGVVEMIGVRSTRIRSLDGFLVTIPNKTICDSMITNVAKRPSIKTTINVGITYETTVEKLKKAIQIAEDIYGNYKATEKVIVSFNQFGDSALNVQILHWLNADAADNYLKHIETMNLELKARYDMEHIDFAYPTQTLYMKQIPN